MTRKAALLDVHVYVITDRPSAGGRAHDEVVGLAIAGGAGMVQLRDKGVPDSLLYEEARSLMRVTSEAGVPLIINDRVDIALAVSADGVHVGQNDMPVEVVRRLLGENKIVGASVHSVEEAARAATAGADYVGVGPVYGTCTKQDARSPVGTDILRAVKSVVNVPVVAIGGLNKDNVEKVILAGADIAAAASFITGATNPLRVTRRMVLRVQSAKSRREQPRRDVSA